ncbi:MAG TPA: DUF362 domain-containing protein [Anaerolineae bacterium]|nr:DUF362 domain-containing protein [Anaerolineae bacterium]HNU05324.1 DUF362 domain-containing protein [Anaerolineae bacterium]
MTKSKVAVLRTSPRTVLADYHRLMNLAGYQDVIARDADTALKVNISWHYFFPASSTTPWQLEGVIRAMQQDGYDMDLLHACHNRTVVIDAHLGERENKQINVVEAHGLRNVHLYEGEEWIHIRDAVGDLADKFLVLNEVYPDGFYIPKRFIGENIIHLPTVKAHIFTTTTGAMKNAFGGLLNERRHWTHPVIHETLVDLLMIQQKIHRGVFAVMDGVFAGDGPGPRCMYPHVKNVLLASSDQVAIDAMAAKLMGFNPLDIKYIRLAHELGLGCGDPDEIEIVGDLDAAAENWHFQGPFKEMTFASRMQHKIYWGPLKAPIEWSLKTVLAPWSYLASVAYHDIYWYPFKAEQMMSDALQSEWGRLFANWEQLQPDELGWADVGQEGVRLERMGMEVIPQSLQVFKTAFTEAPEVAAQRRHHADAAHNAGFSGRSTLDKALIGAGVAAAVAVPTVLAARSLRKHSGNGDQ